MRLNIFKRNKIQLDPKAEAQLAKEVGRHVTTQKAWLMLIFSVLACLVPILLGLRLWDSIPELIETGLVKANGEPDPMPRWALVYILPGLFCLLNAINHQQMRRFQRLSRVPPKHTLLLGRWGFPLFGLLLCAWFIPAAAGRKDIAESLMLLWTLGWALMLLGSSLWDCPPDSKLNTLLPAGLTSGTGSRIASVAALVVGLAILLGTTLQYTA
jgi:hypothetical protein